MQHDKTLKRHAALVDSMADHLGVDLEEQILRANIEPDDIVDMVLTCSKCTNPGACSRLLSLTKELEEAPGYCRNRDTFKLFDT